MPLAVIRRLWNRCANMPFIAQNPPTVPPIRLYLPLGCAYHALLPFVPRSDADRPLVGQNLPPVSFIPQNRPSVISKPNPGCLKSLKKKFLKKNLKKNFRNFKTKKKNFLLPLDWKIIFQNTQRLPRNHEFPPLFQVLFWLSGIHGKGTGIDCPSICSYPSCAEIYGQRGAPEQSSQGFCIERRSDALTVVSVEIVSIASCCTAG